MALIKVSQFSPLNRLQFTWQLKDRYLVGSLVLLGLLLRLPSLRLGLWRDEASTYFDSLPSGLGEVIKTVIRSELNPPGFYLIMHQWMRWFGAEETVLKIPALLFGLLLIVATYGLGRAIGSRNTGLMAAAIATVAPTAVYYSQEVRPYTLTALLSCLVVLLYCKALNSEHQKQYLLGFALCACLLSYVQYTGLLLIFSLIVVTAYLLWRKEGGVRLMPFAFAFGAIFLLFTPWLPIFFTHLHEGTPWSDKVTWWLRPRLFVDCIAYTIPLTKFRTFLVIPVLLAFAVGTMRLFYNTGRSRRPLAAPIVTLGMSVGLIAAIEAALSITGGGRYMFSFTPIAYVLYSSWILALFRYLKRRWERHRILSGLRVAIALVLICWMVFPNVVQAFSWGSLPKSGLRSLAADAQKLPLEQIVYVLAPDYLGPSFGYYFARKHPVPFYGFARWHHPELFSPQGYGDLWESPTAVADALKGIQEESLKGDRWLGLIKDIEPTSNQFFPSKTNQLLSELKQTYPLLRQVDYPSIDFPSHEAVTLYLFALKPQ